ncbi:MAG: PhoH family protein [Thermoproteota archaeon]|jgi:Phosphate starvation-inducible protein PhoH, predicted ATPase
MTLISSLKPLSKGQEELYEALISGKYNIVGIFGPTGSGKSLFSIIYALNEISEGRYKKFVILKPIIDVVTKKEITPQELNSYENIILSYIKDVTGGFIDTSLIDNFYKQGKIEILDTRFLKGRTFDDCVLFVDEIQLMKIESLIEIILRVGKNSRLLIAGDPIFQALQEATENDPSSIVREILLNEENAKVIDLGIKDIARSGAKKGMKLLIEYKLRSRKLNETEQKAVDISKIHSPDADIVTVVDLIESKKHFGLEKLQNIPDLLIIVKEGHFGRMVGKGGERISKIEKDLTKKIRTVELNLNFKDYIRALHPLPWIIKHIEDVDFKGNQLVVSVKKEFGAFLGQKGAYVLFLDNAFQKLLGVRLRAINLSEEKRDEH